MVGYTPKQIEYLVGNSYRDSEGERNLAAELFAGKFGVEITPKEVADFWREAGKLKKPNGGYRNGLREADLRALHERTGGDITKMMQETGRKNPTGLTNALRKINLSYHNLPSQARGSRAFLPDPDNMGWRYK